MLGVRLSFRKIGHRAAMVCALFSDDVAAGWCCGQAWRAAIKHPHVEAYICCNCVQSWGWKSAWSRQYELTLASRSHD